MTEPHTPDRRAAPGSGADPARRPEGSSGQAAAEGHPYPLDDPDGPRDDPDVGQDTTGIGRDDAQADEAARESFPASDAPGSWSGPPN